jgi:hypothetical protein
MGRFRALAMLPLVLALFAFPHPALADKPITVGDGTTASCTEAALKSALLIAQTSGGGTIRFKCGPSPAAIALSGVTEIDGVPVLLVLPNDTTIDGGDLITLDGTGTGIVLYVDSGTTGALTRLTITNGGVPFTFFNMAAGITNLGTLVISKSIVSANVGYFFGTGGIWNTGTLTIQDSVISNNLGDDAGGVKNEGTLTIHNAILAENSAGYGHGGGILNSGTLRINDSTFSHNTAGDGIGGGILNFGTLTVKRSLFAENQAGVYGGGIVNMGTLDVDQSTFSQNLGAGYRFGGGGIHNESVATVKNSTFSGNVGTLGGGIFTAGPLAIRDSIITSNTAGAGGGIYVCIEGDPNVVGCRGTLILRDTIVTDNTPDDIFP